MFRSYQRYKPYLREEFRRRCVYCCRPDGFGSLDEFVVEHYAPRVRFKSLATAYSNLFYACQPCNRYKGPYWADDEARALGRVVVNPCAHVMTDHLRFRGNEVMPQSEEGQWTTSAVRLNSPALLELRDKIRRTIDALSSHIGSLSDDLQRVDAAIRSTPLGSSLQSGLEAARKSIVDDIEAIRSTRRSYTGVPAQ
jgi:hypothetical protein